ncbi:hypothetical protein GC170_17985 [bacterium]|nr:hypothetical protein [bacterium]
MRTAIRRALTVARYDFRYPQSLAMLIVWGLLTVLLALGMSIGIVQISSGSSGVGGVKAHLTSEFSQALQGSVLAVMIDGFFFAVLAGMAVPRDHETRMLEIERSSGLSPRSYVVGKFLGATFWLAMMLALQIAARIFFNHVVPNADMAESRGPLVLSNYIRPMLLIVGPSLLFTGATAFFLGARTKNGVLVFLSPVFLILAYTFLYNETLLNRMPNAVKQGLIAVDPTGTEWLNQKFLREDRGAAYYNTTPIPYEPQFLGSRALILALSLGLVFASGSRAMEPVGSSRRKHKPARIKSEIAEVPVSEKVEAPAISTSLADMGMRTRRPGWLRYVLTIARAESRNLVRGPGLWLFGVIIAFIATVRTVVMPGPLNTTILVTSGDFAAQTFGIVTFCTSLLALFFGMNALERERSARIEPFVFGTPLPISAWLVGKSLAFVIVGFAVVASVFVGMVITILYQRQTGIEWIPLGIIWGLLLLPSFFFWSSCICLFRAVSSNVYAVLALGAFALGLTTAASIRDYMHWANNWPLWSTVRYSDISRFELYREAITANRISMMCWGVFLLTLASVRVTKYTPDIVRWRSRIGFRSILKRYAPAIAASILPLVAYGAIYQRIRQGPEGAVTKKADKDYWRKNVATFFDFKPPTITAVDLKIAIDPAKSSFHADGSFVLKNHRKEPMDEIPMTIGHHLSNETWTWDGKPIVPENRAGLKIVRKPDKTPFAPGETAKFGFIYDGTFPKGMNRIGTTRMEFIVPSSVVLTSFSQSFLPKFGFDENRGLAPRDRPEAKKYPDDYYKKQVDPAIGDGSKMTTNIEVTVPGDFRANSVGTLEKVIEQLDGTKTFVWKSDHPVSFFNIVAGRWTEAKGDGVVIYHDSRHGRNVPEMLRGLEAARKHYGEWFGVFPWKELKLSEFAGLADYAQGFPTNITFSESIGFKTLSDEDSNTAFYVTAHEAAHQWWGNMLVPGAGPGGNVLSEALANYSAIRLVEKELGERARIGLMKNMEFRYVFGRRGDDEQALNKVDGSKPTDQTVTYERGGWVFWMLSRLMGVEAFHKGLAEMIRKYPAGSQDAPLVEDLLEVLREHAPDKPAFDRFADQWIKGKALPNMFLDDVKVADGTTAESRKVTGKVRNDGTGTVEVEVAASVGRRFPPGKSWLPAPPEKKPGEPYKDVRTKVSVEPGKSVDFTIDTPFLPEKVTLDPDLNLLLIGRDRSEKAL